MSIFNKSVVTLNYGDIELLYKEQAIEGIRLEFKREFPDKEEMLKKIASFANTYGGYIVIGIEQDKQAKVASLPGVTLRSGFQQQVIQWAYDGLYPPITPFVSPAIENPNDESKVFYVVHISESHEVPHFLNGRKGCYVRTDEFSQRFEPQLATYEEIQHLANRRERSIGLREMVVARARQRFEEHTKSNYHAHPRASADIDLTMWMAIVPTFPSQVGFEIAELGKAIESARLVARGETFPNGTAATQLDGYYFLNPRILNFSYFEAGAQGLLFYSEEIGRTLSHLGSAANDRTTLQSSSSNTYFYATWLLAWVIFYLRFGSTIYDLIGYDGPVLIRFGLDRIQGRQLRIALDRSGDDFLEGRSLLDNSFHIERTSLTSILKSDTLKLSKDIFRAASFACGWSQAYSASEEFLDSIVDQALDYLKWAGVDFQSK